MKHFYINQNQFLRNRTDGYHHQYYTGFGEPENPDFLNVLKNTFNKESMGNLLNARNKVKEILTRDIPQIIRSQKNRDWMCVCVPRAKVYRTYTYKQLMFKEAVSIAAKNIHGVTDGTECIRRVKNTRTTHLRNATTIPNDGDDPYPGITLDTCEIDVDRISNKNIILIDDIYTKNVNIDEDCIQALLDSGARNVIFYSIGYTRRN